MSMERECVENGSKGEWRIKRGQGKKMGVEQRWLRHQNKKMKWREGEKRREEIRMEKTEGDKGNQGIDNRIRVRKIVRQIVRL